MSNYPIDDRNKVKRVPKRGHYDRETVYKVLDAAFHCHVGFVINDQPFVIPTAFGRKGDKIYLHGATTSRMMMHGEKGFPICVTITLMDGIVLARSAFHHSMNYRSAVVYGTAKLVADKDKEEALKIISDQILMGRWEESRLPNEKELKATSVLEMTIEQGSAKIRTGPPKDDAADYALPIWAGVVPMETKYMDALDDPDLTKGIEAPVSVRNLLNIQ